MTANTKSPLWQITFYDIYTLLCSITWNTLWMPSFFFSTFFLSSLSLLSTRSGWSAVLLRFRSSFSAFFSAVVCVRDAFVWVRLCWLYPSMVRWYRCMLFQFELFDTQPSAYFAQLHCSHWSSNDQHFPPHAHQSTHFVRYTSGRVCSSRGECVCGWEASTVLFVHDAVVCVCFSHVRYNCWQCKVLFAHVRVPACVSVTASSRVCVCVPFLGIFYIFTVA